jgi:broad specificity phosphatase PhoE
VADKVVALMQREDLKDKVSVKNDPTPLGAWVYSSEWTRSVQTAAPFVEKAKTIYRKASFCDYYDTSFKYREDPRLREQEWGNFQEPEAIKALRRERSKFGTFHYRFPGGESGADVYLRVSSFMDTLFRDFEKKDCPRNIVIFSHGLTIRIFLMRWFQWSFKEYENIRNLRNCEPIVLERPCIVKPSLYIKGMYREMFELKSKLRYRQEKK